MSQGRDKVSITVKSVLPLRPWKLQPGSKHQGEAGKLTSQPGSKQLELNYLSEIRK
jgi:hypothetical protein